MYVDKQIDKHAHTHHITYICMCHVLKVTNYNSATKPMLRIKEFKTNFIYAFKLT